MRVISNTCLLFAFFLTAIFPIAIAAQSNQQPSRLLQPLVPRNQTRSPGHTTSSATAHSIYGSENPLPQMPMPLVAPVFLQTDQVDSSLTVVNGINLPAPATITVRDMQGNAILKKSIIFDPHSSTVLTTHDLLAEGGSVVHSGSLTVEQAASVKGPALLGQLSMTLHVGSLPAFLEEELGMPTMHGSQTLRGVSSQTTNLPLIAVTSNSIAPQTITAICVGESSSTTFEVPAGGTTVIRACSWEPMRDNDLGLASALLQTQQSEPKDHAIQLTTDSVPGSFYAFGFALNGSIANAQLQPLDFYDPSQAFSTSTVYVGVPLGYNRLLKDGMYTPTVTLANFSAQPRTAEVLFSDSSSAQPKVTSIAQTSLPAFSTRTLRLTSIPASGVQNTLTIQSDGKPGDLQVHLFAEQSGAERRVEMLAKDAKDDHNGGNHPWSIANGDQSTLLLHNPTTVKQVFHVQISGGGSQWADIFSLAPYETKSVFINEIVVNAIKDHTGRILPGTLKSGEVLWFTPSGASGLGRLFQTNNNTGLARSFSCPTYQNMCSATFGINNFLDTVYDTDAFYSAVIPVVCTEYCSSCCSQTSPTTQSISYSTQWSGNYGSYNNQFYSDSTQLGLHSTAVGTFYISAFATAGSCQAGPISGGGTVQNPGALKAISSSAITYKTPYVNGCPLTAPYGAAIKITYQVLDDTPQHSAIMSSSLEPQEQTSNLVINGNPSGSGAAPNWSDIGPSTYFDGTSVPGTSKYTTSQGTFIDAPFQLCSTGSFSSITITQAIRIQLKTFNSNVRTNNWTVTSSSIGHGTISNGGDVNQTF